jgi:signal peptidase I
MRNLVIIVAALLCPASAALMAQTPVSYNRGDTVRIQSKDQTRPSPDPRIVAVAGDRVRIDTSGVFVNEIPLVWVSRDFAANYGRRQPWDSLVPQGQYVVIADYRMNQEVSQFLGFVSENSIVGRVEDIDGTRGVLLPATSTQRDR